MEICGPRRMLCSGAGMGLPSQEAEPAEAEGSLVTSISGCQKSELSSQVVVTMLWRAGVNAGQERGNFSMNRAIVQNKCSPRLTREEWDQG